MIYHTHPSLNFLCLEQESKKKCKDFIPHIQFKSYNESLTIQVLQSAREKKGDNKNN